MTCATESHAFSESVLAPGISSCRMFGNTLQKHWPTRSLMLFISRRLNFQKLGAGPRSAALSEANMALQAVASSALR